MRCLIAAKFGLEARAAKGFAPPGPPPTPALASSSP